MCCSQRTFFFNHTATTEIYTLSLHDALPISGHRHDLPPDRHRQGGADQPGHRRSEEHTSELQSRPHLVCRLLLEKKKDRGITCGADSFRPSQYIGGDVTTFVRECYHDQDLSS